MANLTTKELAGIQDQLGVEQTMIKKYKMYGQSVTDPQLKNKCEQIAARHQDHFNRLMGHL